jgi:tRNA 2-thiouridine synthesizing protein A
MGSHKDILDLRGLKCPMPSLLARRALLRAPAGTSLTVLTDDPLAPIDVPHMCGREGFEVVSVARNGDETEMILRKPVPADV